MSERNRNFAIGGVTITALIGLSLLLLRFGELDQFLRPSYDVAIELNAAGTTRPGSAVQLNGVRIGAVTAVELRSDPASHERPVLILASVQNRYLIPIGTTAEVVDALVGGGGRIELHMPDDPEPTRANFPTDGSAIIVGSWQSMTDAIVEQLRIQLDGKMEPLMASLDAFNAVATSWTTVGERVSSLLAPENMEEPGSIVGAVQRFEITLNEAAEAISLAREWLGDEQLRADINAAAWKANRLLESATAAAETIGKLAETAGTDLNRLTAAALPVTEEMSLTLERLTELLTLAAQGDGTIGQLISNPDLYQSLEEAARRLESTLENFELLLQKIRDEGLVIGG